MQKSRLVRLVLVVTVVLQASILVASPTTSEVSMTDIKSTPSKVCNPKKPVTCRAATITESAQSSSPETAVTPKVATFERVCMGGLRSIYCKANTLAEVKPVETEQKVATFERVCMGGLRSIYCRANTLG